MPPPADAEPIEALRAAQRAHRRPPLGPLLSARRLGHYRGYGELLGELEALVERGARLAVIGRSVKGEPIFAVHLGAAQPKARTTATLSLVHPMEWIGVEVHLALLRRLAESYLDGRAVIAVPIVNPDGVIRVEAQLRAGRRGFVRHNAHGVDLNRNFDARWHDRGLAQRLLSFIYAPGSRPASEPEVAAIAHHLAARRVDRSLSLHSFGGAVLYPSAATLWPIWDAAEHRAWAARIAEAADEKPYRTASCARWSLGMTAGGLDVDWMHDRHGAVSLLVECSRRNAGLHPARLFEPFAWFNPRNPAGVAATLGAAMLPFARGDSL
jgi:hypothetical protein